MSQQILLKRAGNALLKTKNVSGHNVLSKFHIIHSGCNLQLQENSEFVA